IAPEYEWQVMADGRTAVIMADRDGDTISRARGVYAVHPDRPVTPDEVRARLAGHLAAERALRALGQQMYGSIEAEVRAITEQIDVARVYQHAKALYDFGSKYITQPGNALAIEYLQARLREMGYEPELQWFEPAGRGGAAGVRTAN